MTIPLKPTPKSKLSDYKNLLISDLLKETIAKKTIQILDVGCGRGEIDYLLSSQTKAQIIALDLDVENISIAKKNNSHPNLTFKVGNGSKLPFKDNTFDVVLALGADSVVVFPEILSEVKRVLKRHGVIVCDFSNHHSIYKIPLYLTKIGFRKHLKIFRATMSQKNYDASFHHFGKIGIGNYLAKNKLDVIDSQYLYSLPPFCVSEKLISLDNFISKYFGLFTGRAVIYLLKKNAT